MAENYLITGYWGEPHVTAENDRGIHAAIFGAGRFVLPVGERFRAEYIGNNTIRMYDGKLLDNGAAAGIPAGEYIDLVVSTAGQGMKRNDLIVFQYEKDATSMVETGKFVVVKGTETSGAAADPALTQADLLSDKATFDQMALWRVPVSGTTIAALEQLFAVRDSIQAVSDAAASAQNTANAAMPKSGGIFTGKVEVSGGSGSVDIFSDNEGGNIVIHSPTANGDCWQMDSYDGNLRFFHSDNSVEADHRLTFDKDGVIHPTGGYGGGTFVGAVTLSGAPTANLHPATKQYVDDRTIGYSTNEQSTGVTWIDGKTIYRKVYILNISSTGTEITVTNTSFDTVVNYTVYRVTGNNRRHLNNASCTAAEHYYETGKFAAWSEHIKGTTCYLVLEYTKK